MRRQGQRAEHLRCCHASPEPLNCLSNSLILDFHRDRSPIRTSAYRLLPEKHRGGSSGENQLETVNQKRERKSREAGTPAPEQILVLARAPESVGGGDQKEPCQKVPVPPKRVRFWLPRMLVAQEDSRHRAYLGCRDRILALFHEGQT